MSNVKQWNIKFNFFPRKRQEKRSLTGPYHRKEAQLWLITNVMMCGEGQVWIHAGVAVALYRDERSGL
jgi:hypothetical protein